MVIKFKISEDITAAYPELIELIIKTESMNDTEKQYWFDLLNDMLMNEEQIDRLFDILNTEKFKLEELNAKYLASWEELAINP